MLKISVMKHKNKLTKSLGRSILQVNKVLILSVLFLHSFYYILLYLFLQLLNLNLNHQNIKDGKLVNDIRIIFSILFLISLKL